MFIDQSGEKFKIGQITLSMFIQATGYMPEDDDLERSNCPKAGQPLHEGCGWNHKLNQPMFYGRTKYPRGKVQVTNVPLVESEPGDLTGLPKLT